MKCFKWKDPITNTLCKLIESNSIQNKGGISKGRQKIFIKLFQFMLLGKFGQRKGTSNKKQQQHIY